MSEKYDNFVVSMAKNQEEVREMVEKLYTVAQPGAVYSEPVESGELKVITAAEVSVGLGFGYGGGFGPSESAGEHKGEEKAEAPAESDLGAGVGGGGGGGASGRPVAVISIGPEGVDVEPVVDVTKVALAFFTALGSMFIMFSKMRKAK